MPPEVESDQQNQNGQGGSVALTAIAFVVVTGIAIGKLIEALFEDRSVVVEISNNTPSVLNHTGDHHDSGAFVSPPPAQIEPNTSEAFTSQSTTVLTGTIGNVTYAGDGFTITCGWDDPEVGSNSTTSSLDGPRKSKFLLRRVTGDGNQGAHMMFILNVHPDYSVMQSLRNKGDLTKGIRALRPGASTISLRDLVDY